MMTIPQLHIPHVIVDIASPPTGVTQSFQPLYSPRTSASWHSIHLLRDFDDKMILKKV